MTSASARGRSPRAAPERSRRCSSSGAWHVAGELADVREARLPGCRAEPGALAELWASAATLAEGAQVLAREGRRVTFLIEFPVIPGALDSRTVRVRFERDDSAQPFPHRTKGPMLFGKRKSKSLEETAAKSLNLRPGNQREHYRVRPARRIESVRVWARVGFVDPGDCTDLSIGGRESNSVPPAIRRSRWAISACSGSEPTGTPIR